MYKHLTSIKKRREEDCSHSHTHTHQNRTPEKNDQKGAAQHPKTQVERTGGGKKKRKRKKKTEEKEIMTISYLKFSIRRVAVVMQDIPAPQARTR